MLVLVLALALVLVLVLVVEDTSLFPRTQPSNIQRFS